MADVGLDGGDVNAASFFKDVGDGVRLDGISDWSAGAVTLKIRCLGYILEVS